MISALVFDFDGLMVDTEATSLQSWQELYAEHGLELPLDLWATLIGTWDAAFNPATYLEERIGRALTESEHAERYAREWRLAAEQPLMPGVVTHIEAAEKLGLPLAVASSSSRRWVEGHLADHGLREHFACVLTRDDVTLTKPDPELYLAAAACLRVPPSRTLAYEDSNHGVTAAKDAGMWCLAVPGPLTAESDFSRADRVVGSLADVKPLELWESLDREA
jgi:HAD superfamily hydrolase (TIGR01509 family)